MTWAAPGVKCVCIRRIEHRSTGMRLIAPHLPAYGRVYTIRAVGCCPICGATTLRFEGLVNPIIAFGGDEAEIGFGIDGFRPLVTHTLDEDLTIFRRIAADASHEVDA